MDSDGGSLPPAVTQNQLLKHLLDVKGLGPGRLIGDVAQRREKSPKDLEVSVFQTLLVKSITEDHNGALFLVGTLIQRTIGVDLEADCARAALGSFQEEAAVAAADVNDFVLVAQAQELTGRFDADAGRRPERLARRQHL